MYKKPIFIFAIFMLLCSNSMWAQNNTNSPYTRFGYGELSDNTSGKSKAMGGASLGMRSNTSINMANPASYTGVDTMSFLLEFGAMGRISHFSTAAASASKFAANFDYFALKFPITKYLGFSAGLLPYSMVGYDYSSVSPHKYNGNDIFQTETHKGLGGITQLYGGIAGKIGKHVSLGINLSYLFGSVENVRTLSFTDTAGVTLDGFFGTTQTSRLKVSDINLRYGVQYYTDIKEKYFLTLGAVFEAKSKLNGSYTIETSMADTVSEKNGSNFHTPMTIGGGVSFGQKNKFLVAADALYQGWADTKFFSKADSLKNRLKISLGGEFTPQIYSRNYFARMTYRLGANYTNGYWNVNGTSPSSYGISFGLGFPIRGYSSVNLGFEYGKFGKASASQISEQYFRISINATFGEVWFFKRRID